MENLNYKLSEESANDQMEVLLDYYDVDESEFDDDDKRANFKDTVKKLVKHIRRGRVVIELDGDNLKVMQFLKFSSGDSNEVSYVVIKAQHKVASDAAGDKKYTRIPALMGSLSGLGERAIKQFKGVDMSAMECLAAVFFSV